jgi:hypothetical protein
MVRIRELLWNGRGMMNDGGMERGEMLILRVVGEAGLGDAAARG